MKVLARILAGAGLLASLWLLPPLPLVAALHVHTERLQWVLLAMAAFVALQLAYMAVEYRELVASEEKAMAAGTREYGDAFADAVRDELAI
jgi:hypothetical protein